MRTVLLLLPSNEVDAPAAALAALADREYSMLCPPHRLALLRALCDTWLGSPSGQLVLSADASKHSELSAGFARESAERESAERAAALKAHADMQLDRSILIVNSHHQLPLAQAAQAPLGVPMGSPGGCFGNAAHAQAES